MIKIQDDLIQLSALLKEYDPKLIADAIKKEYCEPAHDSYVKMVWATPSLSATAFLTNLYALAAKDWDFSKTILPNEESF